MDNYTIVRPEHLNHHGYLFGGAMLKWIDEFAWLVASRDFVDCTFVTVAMDHVSFKHRVKNGSILRFHIVPQHVGTTSVVYGVTVFADAPGEHAEIAVLSTQVTFVRVDDGGHKCALPKLSYYRSLGGPVGAL